MSRLTSHVLDTSSGRPAAGLPVELAFLQPEEWQDVARAVTDRDGRVRRWDPPADLKPGTWRLRFRLEDYFEERGADCFHPWVDVVFHVTDPESPHHVPLLISPFGYTTYRGS